MKKYQNLRRVLMVVERAGWWNSRARRVLRAAPLVVMFLLLNSSQARSSCSFNPAPDPTHDGSANSLRHAIQAANASGQDCLIRLQAGTYTLSIPNASGQENAAAQGDLDITASGHTVTIQGQGPQATIINGNGIDRVFQVLGGANAAFSALRIEGGVAQDNGKSGVLPGSTTAQGGALLLRGGGKVTLSRVSISGNEAIGGGGADGVSTESAAAANGSPGEAAQGGGIFVNTGNISVTDSQLLRNIATAGKGGFGASHRCHFVTNSTGQSVLSCPGFSGVGGAGGAAAGGGLYVLSGSATLIRSTVSGNNLGGALGGFGGEFFATTIDGCCREGGNGGAAQGAGVFVAGGTLRLSRTTVSGNSGTGGEGGFGGLPEDVPRGASGGSSKGAGVFVNTSNISVANSTLFTNTANGGQGGFTRFSALGRSGDTAGGGLYIKSGSISLAGATLASNQALGTVQSSNNGTISGGGIANGGAGLFTTTTLIGNNTLGYSNCSTCSVPMSKGYDLSGPITLSHSLISQTAGATITDNGGNIFDVDPALDPGGLKLNGGPTQTVALQSTSPAIDAVPLEHCTDLASPPHPLTTDQRGLPRPDYGELVCDIGAYESQETFAGHPGASNCQGVSASELANRYGTINAAASALHFPGAQALQAAIRAFCGQ